LAIRLSDATLGCDFSSAALRRRAARLLLLSGMVPLGGRDHGFDVSHRSIRLIRRLVFSSGRGIDDLVEHAVRIARIRHRANAWGFRALKLGSRRSRDDYGATQQIEEGTRSRWATMSTKIARRRRRAATGVTP
jgi:hypothetical protein